VDGEPALEPFTSGSVTFTTACGPGSAPRAAKLSAPNLADVVDLSFTLEPAARTEWAALSSFLKVAPVALVVLLIPFLVWRLHPKGNPSPGVPDVDPLPWKGLLGTSLPGITKDWSLSENWASSITLGAGLFTAFFASTDLLPSILGPESAAKSTVVVAAVGVSAALVAAGPLWLTIFKRRVAKENGVARDNTVAGVLVSSTFVLVGALGGVWSIAGVVNTDGAILAAAAVSALLVLFTAKSIPQTLALGLYGVSAEEGRRTVAASL
jgi:hypothetical protein